jgi:hypothetical protein
MRRGLAGAVWGLWLAVNLGWAEAPAPRPPAEPKPVTPVIPLKSDAGIPFVAQSGPYVPPEQQGFESVELGPRCWIGGEFLMHWIKRQPLSQPLATTSADDPFVNPGRLGDPGTVVLLGGHGIDDCGYFPGVRLSAGFTLDECGLWAAEGSVVYFAEQTSSFRFASDGNGDPVLSRPIIDALTDTEDVLVIAFPGARAGQIGIDARTQLWGAETNVVRKLMAGGWGGIDLIGGVRFAELEEALLINDATLLLPLGSGSFLGEFVGPDSTLARSDAFETRNQFIGGQVGLKAEIRRGNWFVDGKTKLAMGNTHQVLNINGSSTLIPPGGGAVTVPGGLLALSSNSGRQVNNDFGVIPEVSVNVGYQLSEGIRVFVGYDLMYWSNVVRPGDSIDRSINRSLVPTSEFFGGQPLPQEPVILFRSTDFWMQGVNFGIAVRF